METFLQVLPDGTLMDWGRYATVNGRRGTGGAVRYCGEAAEVMKLVLLHTDANAKTIFNADVTKRGV